MKADSFFWYSSAANSLPVSGHGKAGAMGIREYGSVLEIQPGSSHARSSLGTSWSQNHRITESQNSRGWKGPLWVI